MRSLVVIKFGGSVLTGRGAIPAAVQEISRYLASYEHVIAVVSAFKDQTDALESAAFSLCPQPDPNTLAFYLGLGEMQSTGELTMGLQHAGIDATLRMPWDVSFVSTGPELDAMPVSISTQAFHDAFRDNRVVVFPGFLGRGSDGMPHVLGRGGSDLTAIFLAAELRAQRCIMLKDVPGVFEWDPALEGPRPRHYSRISWDDAASVGGVVRPADMDYAHARSVKIEVMAPGTPISTTVGPEPSELDPPGEPRQLKQGLHE
jgi:homoserine dehydrogenase